MTDAPFKLDDVRIASPCSASWDDMEGDDRSRFCGRCRLNVYNLSAMTRRDAEALVATKEGRLCVRFYRRRDGTMLTADCPKGVLRAARRRLAKLAASVLGALGLSMAGCGRDPFRTMGEMCGPPTAGRMSAPESRPAAARPTMGDVAAPPSSAPR